MAIFQNKISKIKTFEINYSRKKATTKKLFQTMALYDDELFHFCEENQLLSKFVYTTYVLDHC